MEFIEKIERVILKVLQYMLSAILIAVAISVSWGVFTRYVLNNASQWTHEFSGFGLAWLTFLGAAYALFNGNHIRFETLYDKLPRRIQLVLRTVFNGLMLAFVGYLTYYGYFLALRSLGNDTISLPLTKGYFFSVIPIAGALMVLALIFDTIKAFKNDKKVETRIEEERLI